MLEKTCIGRLKFGDKDIAVANVTTTGQVDVIITS